MTAPRYSICITDDATEMPRCFSISIQSEVAWRDALRAFTDAGDLDRAGKEQELLGQRRLAGVGVGNDGEGAAAPHLGAEFGHGAASIARKASAGSARPIASAAHRAGRAAPAHFVQYTHRYTRAHQTVAWPIRQLLTIDDWIAASARDASPREPLLALQRRLEAESPPGVWIALVDRAGIESQVASLEARAARCSDAGALRRTMPLFGVPFAVKDNIDVAGLADHRGVPGVSLRRRRATRTRSQKLIAAGAVCVGKTNLDQFATGLVGTRSPYGRPSSAFAAERISGGSSSGSAVVVARGDVPFALGTDTAGSGRVPAALQQHRRPEADAGARQHARRRAGVPQLDCVSIFALTVADAARVLALDRRRRRRRRLQRLRARAGARPRRAARRHPGAAGLPRRRRLRPGLRARRRGAARRSATRSCRSTSRRCTRSPSCSTTGRGWPSGMPSSQTLLEREPEAIEPTVRGVIAAARAMSRDRRLPRPLRAARGAARHARDLGARRPADGADRARPSAPRRGRRRPDRRQRAARRATPTSSTCSAGARWRCRPASPAAACRSA